MRTLSKAIRLGITAMMVALMLGAAPHVAAQPQEFDPNIYTSTLTGIDIEVSGPIYEIREAELQHYLNGEGEIVQIGSGSTVSSLEVSFFDDGDTPNGSIDIYLNAMESAADEFEILDRGMSGDYAYAFAHIDYDGVDILYYIQVYEDIEGSADLLEAILSSSVSFEDDLVAAQAEVTVDGVQFMENVDAADISSVASGGESLGEEAEATPVEPSATATFTLSSASVGIGPDFTFVGDPETVEGFEYVRIQGSDTLSMVAIGQSGAGPADVISGFTTGISSVYSDTQMVYEEIGSDDAWRILWIPKENDAATFMLIVVDTASVPGAELMHAHELPAHSVAGSIITIQDQVTFNGQPLMPEIDPAEIAFYTDRYGGDDRITGTPDVTVVATAEATVVSGEGRTGNPRDDARLPSGNEGDANTSETDDGSVATAEATSESTEGAGILTDSSWEGGVLGHVIEWNPDDWFVDTEYPDDLISDEDAQEDTIVLQASTTSGNTWFFISVYDGETEITPDDYLDYWTSAEFMESETMSGTTAELLSSRTRGGSSGVVIRYTNESGNEFVIVRQATMLDDGSMMIITLDAPAEDAIDMYSLALDVTVDGDPGLRVFSVSQIERAIGD